MNNILKFFLESGAEDILHHEGQDRTNPASQAKKEVEKSSPIAALTEDSSPVHETNAENRPKSDSTRTIADQCQTLEELKAAITSIDNCELKKQALNTVFADGAAGAKIMMIGEAPGQQEDIEGIPFCGQSGKLLNLIMAAAGYPREQLYITNTVFWRPPSNRRPTPDEINFCRPLVEKHIALLNPEMILLVGSTAVESLLDSKQAMHSIRQKMFSYTNQYLKRDIPTFVIFHPSYLLRQPRKKRDMWQDLQYIQNYIKSELKNIDSIS